MSPFNWFLLLVVVAIFLFGFILIVARIARPHSKKMARGQAQLNKKRGATAPAAAAGTAGVSPVTPSTLGERASEWFMKYLWSILIVIALVGLVLWGLSGTLGTPSQSLQSPSLKTVWEGTKNYWLWIVLILAIMFFLSFIVAKPWAKALQGFLVAVAVMLFIGIPLVHVIWGEKQPSTVACKPYSSAETRHCLVAESGVILASGESIRPVEFEFCYIKPEKAELQAQWMGPNALQVRSMHGTFPLQYRMIRWDTLINGSCPAVLS